MTVAHQNKHACALATVRGNSAAAGSVRGISVKRCFTLLALAFAAANAAAADLMVGGAGWEVVATPAVALADVVTVRPDGVVAVSSESLGYIASAASYRNYHLHVEWRWSDKPGNAGVLLHISPGPMDRVWPLSVQVQTKHGSAGDLLPMAGARFAEPLSGAAVPLKARIAADSEKPVGEWNSCDIVARDGVVEVSVNGISQNRASALAPAAGRVGFQLEGTPYELRRVTLVPLDGGKALDHSSLVRALEIMANVDIGGPVPPT